MTEIRWWKKEPKPPIADFRAWALLIPAAFSAIGFFAFAVLAYSFTEISLLSRNFRVVLVIIGAFSLAVGGEIGTLSATVEIYRKHRRGETIWWDWIGLVVSLFATVAEFVIAFATLLGVKAHWSLNVQLYGPIALGALSAFDSYVNFMEVGFYLADYDRRYDNWLRQYQSFVKGTYFEDAQPKSEKAQVAQPEPQAEAKPAPTLREFAGGIDAWRELAAKLNGGGANLTGKRINEILQERGFAPVPDSTARYWARVTREGA